MMPTRYFKDAADGLYVTEIVDGDEVPAWLEGKSEITKAEYDVLQPAALPPTEDDYSLALQSMLDAKAQEHQYDEIQSAITYRGDANARFAAEAEALFAWRSAVWTYATAQLTAVMAGTRTQPSVSDFVTEVQAQCPFEWPA